MDSKEFATNNMMNKLEEAKVVKYGEFTLASGKKSDYYIDMRNAVTHPRLLKMYVNEILSERFLDYNREKNKKSFIDQRKIYDRIASIEVGAVPLGAVLSYECGVPSLIVRKKTKGHGTEKIIEGNFEPGMKTLFVEDTVTTAGTLVRGIQAARDVGLEVTEVIAWVDREEGATENLKEIDVELKSILTASQLKEYHQKIEANKIA